MTGRFEAEGKRVLICEGDQDIAGFLRLLLEQFGLVVDVACDAAQAKARLAQNDYAAMTLDLALPDQDGMALIRELRLAPETSALPILVVSAQAAARRGELDDEASGVIGWIDKPIDCELLAEALQEAVGQIPVARLGPMPRIRPEGGGMAILDLSLPDDSGSIRDQLHREVARARRKKTPLSFALADIDLFAQINDACGYDAGNRVIHALLRLLKQRLREADLVGHYGGDEFAIILCDADGDAAVKVMDNIRKDFSGLRHVAEGKEFTATFSCGISDISRFGDAGGLWEAAEKAQYNAKQAGRNRVVLAQ